MNKVSVGLGTIIGYGGAFLAAAVATVEALQANGPNPESVKWLLILAAAKSGLTTFGRMYQAANITPAVGPEVLTTVPETAVTPDNAAI